MEEHEYIRSEESEGVFVVTMDDPRTRNSLGPEMSAGLHRALDRFESDPDLRVLVLTGRDPAFCSGANVRGFQRSNEERERPGAAEPPPVTPWQVMDPRHALQHRGAEAQAARGQFLPWRLWQIQKPTIAAVNGFAFGVGAGLALCCDIRIASDRGVFSEAFVRMGLVPGDGSCWQLPRLIGMSNALLLQYTGDQVNASEAARMGLVSREAPHEDLMSTVMELATRIAQGPTFSHGLIKYLVHAGLESDFRTNLELSNAALALARQTEDHREGARAFVEKRRPVFRGR